MPEYLYKDKSKFTGIVSFFSDATFVFDMRRNIDNADLVLSTRTESILRDTLHHAPDVFIILNSAREIVYANEATRKEMGYPNTYLTGKQFDDLVPAENRLEMELFFNSLTQSTDEESYIKEFTLERSDGTLVTSELFIRVIQIDGTTLYSTCIRTVTDRLKLAAELAVVTEKLTKVNTLMERFLYSSSHDLRSPLTSVLGLVNLIKMESNDRIVLDYVSKIEESAFKLDKILKDIIDFSKTTYQRVRSKRIDFNELAWKVIRNKQRSPASKNLKFEVIVDDQTPFFSDPERLEIIFDNLIRNSRTFLDQAKSFSFLRVSISVSESHATIEFSDNGIGIAKIHLDNIFNIFYKASELSKGAGLGLYIVKEGVIQLNGSILIDSEVGFGTSLHITIPNNPKGKLITKKLNLLNSKNKPIP